MQPRKIHPFLTERLLMGRKESNQTNKDLILHVNCLLADDSHSISRLIWLLKEATNLKKLSTENFTQYFKRIRKFWEKGLILLKKKIWMPLSSSPHARLYSSDSLFITLCPESIGVCHVVSEPCCKGQFYKGIIGK